MLRSFGVETTRGAAALVLDTIVFYLARFVAPVIGLVLTLLVAATGGHPGLDGGRRSCRGRAPGRGRW